jgi:hypothetical protein
MAWPDAGGVLRELRFQAFFLVKEEGAEGGHEHVEVVALGNLVADALGAPEAFQDGGEVGGIELGRVSSQLVEVAAELGVALLDLIEVEQRVRRVAVQREVAPVVERLLERGKVPVHAGIVRRCADKGNQIVIWGESSPRQAKLQ